jgi:hypothetical protein
VAISRQIIGHEHTNYSGSDDYDVHYNFTKSLVLNGCSCNCSCTGIVYIGRRNIEDAIRTILTGDSIFDNDARQYVLMFFFLFDLNCNYRRLSTFDSYEDDYVESMLRLDSPNLETHGNLEKSERGTSDYL